MKLRDVEFSKHGALLIHKLLQLSEHVHAEFVAIPEQGSLLSGLRYFPKYLQLQQFHLLTWNRPVFQKVCQKGE